MAGSVFIFVWQLLLLSSFPGAEHPQHLHCMRLCRSAQLLAVQCSIPGFQSICSPLVS